MGSSFFSDIINPLAPIFSHVGSQSTLGKTIVNDPINRATGGAIQPVSGNYGSSQWQGTVAPPNAYAGVPATLAAANTGYGTLTPAQQQARPVAQGGAPFSFNTGAAAKGGSGGSW